MFFGKTLYSHSAFLLPGVQTGIGEFNTARYTSDYVMSSSHATAHLVIVQIVICVLKTEGAQLFISVRFASNTVFFKLLLNPHHQSGEHVGIEKLLTQLDKRPCFVLHLMKGNWEA